MERTTLLQTGGVLAASDTALSLVSTGGGLVSVLTKPFRDLARDLINTLVDVMVTSATIYPNPAVEDIYRLTLGVAVVGAALVMALAGIYTIVDEYSVLPGNARAILLRLVIGLGFAVVALPIMQTGIELADALVEAFRPQGPVEFEQVLGIEATFLLAWFINAWVLLALVVLFLLRNVYLLFVAAVTPLLAVGWAFPTTRPYAQSFISLWFVALAIGPADALVLNISMTMMQATGELGLQPVSNWVFGTASFVLLLWVPYQLYSVSNSTIGGRNPVRSVRAAW